MRRRTLLIVVLVMFGFVTALKPTSSLQAAPSAASSGFTYFSETGHNIGLRVKSFYDRNGGLPIFGLPLTELFEEDGRMVQYFERARFEMYPENAEAYKVQLTLLG